MSVFVPAISHTATRRQPFGVVKAPVKGALSEVNTGSPIFEICTTMDGVRHAHFHVKIIDLLDKIFLTDLLNLATVEQERFFSRFFNQAGIVDRAINESAEDIYKDVDDVMRDFDRYLGSYIGVNDGEYAR